MADEPEHRATPRAVSPRESPERGTPPREALAARLAGAGVRGAGRAATLTGLDQAVDRAAEEAIVRALESPAVERALARVVEAPATDAALERALASEELEQALVQVLDSEMVDRIWERLLASDEAQRLVERIAQAPEIRQALASQGFGLLADIGRQVRRLTDGFDDALEHLAARLRRRVSAAPATAAPAAAGTAPAPSTAGGTALTPPAAAGTPATEPTAVVGERIGLATRAVATLVDAALINGAFFLTTAVLGATLGAAMDLDLSGSHLVVSGAGAWTVGAGLYLWTFWALTGQTPGMRFLSIRIEHRGSGELGWRRALRRLLAAGLSVLALGLPFLRAVFAADRRTFHDHRADTDVVAFDPVASWAAPPPGAAPPT